MKSIRKSFASILILGAAISGLAAARGQTVNPVPAPTIITSVPYTISAAGYYQLGANLATTNTSGNIITIAANNVTLDFAGHYISGPASGPGTLYGVGATDYNNLTVINGTIANCYEGINFYGNGESTANYNQYVNNMLVTFCTHIGINFQYTFYSRATNNVVSNSGGATAQNGTGNYAIYLNGTNSSVSSNIIDKVSPNSSGSATAFGIFCASGSTSLLLKNQIFSSYYGIYFDGTGKYQDSLTLGCTTAFTGGTDATGNN